MQEPFSAAVESIMMNLDNVEGWEFRVSLAPSIPSGSPPFVIISLFWQSKLEENFWRLPPLLPSLRNKNGMAPYFC